MTTLDIDVTAYPGPTFASGLAFKYAPTDPKAGTGTYLENGNGDIALPYNSEVTILFHLKTGTVKWPDQPDTSYNLSFSPQNALKIWDPSDPAKTSRPIAFGAPALSSANMVVSVTDTTGNNVDFYKYALAVSATSNNVATSITVDPRIRNGGNRANFGPYVVGVLAGVALAVAVYAGWRFLAARRS